MMAKFLSPLFSSLGEKSQISPKACDLIPVHSQVLQKCQHIIQCFQFPNTIKFSHFRTVKCINGRGRIRLTQTKIFMIAIFIERAKGNLLEDIF